MALIVSASLESGIQVDHSYARIDYLGGNKNKVTVNVNYYLDEKAATDGLPPFKKSIHEFVPSESEQSLRWDKQGYEYLKTLPEFESAIDV